MPDEIHYVGHLVDGRGNAIIWDIDPPAIAVLPDDSIVSVKDSIHAGAFGGNLSTWICILVRRGKPGIYRRMAELPGAISHEMIRRSSLKKSNKTWSQSVGSLGLQVLQDQDLEAEVIEYGWSDLLQRFR